MQKLTKYRRTEYLRGERRENTRAIKTTTLECCDAQYCIDTAYVGNSWTWRHNKSLTMDTLNKTTWTSGAVAAMRMRRVHT